MADYLHIMLWLQKAQPRIQYGQSVLVFLYLLIVYCKCITLHRLSLCFTVIGMTLASNPIWQSSDPKSGVNRSQV